LRLTPQRPSHPAPNVRDDREPPLLWERDSENYKFDLGLTRSGIFLQRGLDRFSRATLFLPDGQITCRFLLAAFTRFSFGASLFAHHTPKRVLMKSETRSDVRYASDTGAKADIAGFPLVPRGDILSTSAVRAQ
jgi:hypothetical protein